MSDRRRHSGQTPPALEGERAEAWLALAATQQTAPGAHPDDAALSAWHERLLEPAQAQLVEQHVAHCDRCFAIWNDLVELDGQAQSPIASHGVAARLRAALRTWFGTAAGLRQVGIVATSLFLAVALSVVIFTPREPVPAYNLSVEGNTQYFRDGDTAAEGDSVVFETGNQFRIILTPDTAYSGAIDATVYVERAAAELARLSTPPPQISDTGALRIDARVGEGVRLQPGRYDLLVVVGQRGGLPDPPALASALGDRTAVATQRWQAWRIPIEMAAH